MIAGGDPRSESRAGQVLARQGRMLRASACVGTAQGSDKTVSGAICAARDPPVQPLPGMVRAPVTDREGYGYNHPSCRSSSVGRAAHS